MERFDDWLSHDMCALLSSMSSIEDRLKARKAGFSIPYTQAESDFMEGYMSYSEERIEMEFTCHINSHTLFASNDDKKVEGYSYTGAVSNAITKSIQSSIHIKKIYEKRKEMEPEEWERSFELLLNVMYRLNVPYYHSVKSLGLQHKLKRVPPADLFLSATLGDVQEIRALVSVGDTN